MEINNTNIGIKIKKLREEANLTQNQIAEYLSVDQSLVSKFEKGERSMNSDIVSQLATLFCCEVSNLISNEVEISKYDIAFRASALDNDDLKSLAIINKIVLNQLKMDQLIGEIEND